MRWVVFCLLALIITTGCNSVRTWTRAVNRRPPLSNETRCYTYYVEDEQTIPDSSVKIGYVMAGLQSEENIYGLKLHREALKKLEVEAKSYGANLLNIAIIRGGRDESQLLLIGEMYLVPEFETTAYTDSSIAKIWRERQRDSIEGFYESSLDEFGYEFKGYWAKYAIVKRDSQNYVMVYLSGYEGMNCYYMLNNIEHIWRPGDVCAYIQATEKPNLFRIKQLTYNKFQKGYSMLHYDNGNLSTVSNDGYQNYRKIYPTTAPYYTRAGSLTGFYIGNGRIMTCYHGVTDKEKKIVVKGADGDFEKKIRAKVEFIDKDNDIAIIKVNDSIKINAVPFAMDESEKKTGEEVFVLGYPYSSLLGEEIKLTDGLISSTSGSAGDLTSYQISVAIQPGNSGSPLFDKNGNFIGMVQSKYTNMDNVSYSIKLEQIKAFLKSKGVNWAGAAPNAYKDLSLPEKVDTLQKSIFLIEIVEDTPPEHDYPRMR